MSFTVEDIRREYNRLDRLCGADTSQVALRISSRARKRLGSCKYVGEQVACITISDFVLAAAPEVFYDTIRHEYAHALVKLRRPKERHAHDAVWKAACREVCCAPEPYCADKTMITEGEARRKAGTRYLLRCTRCGAQWRYSRRTKAITLVEKGLSRYCTCPRCKGHAFTVEKPG